MATALRLPRRRVTAPVAAGIAHQFHPSGIPTLYSQLDEGVFRSQQIPRHPTQRLHGSCCRSAQVRTKNAHIQLRVSSNTTCIRAPTQERYTLVSSVSTGVASIVALLRRPSRSRCRFRSVNQKRSATDSTYLVLGCGRVSSFIGVLSLWRCSYGFPFCVRHPL